MGPSSVVETALARPLSSRQRRWWLLERSAHSLDLFRIVAGGALCAHFVAHYRETASLFVWIRPRDLQLLGNGLRTLPESLAPLNDPGASQIAFALGAALSASIALGILPRAAAAVAYVISALTYRVVFPIAGLDDYLASVTAFFLTLMPIGRTLTIFNRAPNRGRNVTVTGVAPTAFLSLVVLFYLTGAVSGDVPTGYVLGPYVTDFVRLIPAAFVLPMTFLPFLGVAAQVGLHLLLVLKTPSFFANSVLATSAVLFWGELEGAKKRPPAVDAGGIVAGACGFATFLAVGATCLGLALPTTALSATLLDFGLLPPTAAPSPSPTESVTLRVSDPRTDQLQRVPLPFHGRLAGRLVSVLGGDRTTPTRRLAFVRTLAGGYCHDSGYLGQNGLLTWSNGHEERSLAEFECGVDGAVAAVR
jgi:hypothetical protein